MKLRGVVVGTAVAVGATALSVKKINENTEMSEKIKEDAKKVKESLKELGKSVGEASKQLIDNTSYEVKSIKEEVKEKIKEKEKEKEIDKSKELIKELYAKRESLNKVTLLYIKLYCLNNELDYLSGEQVCCSLQEISKLKSEIDFNLIDKESKQKVVFDIINEINSLRNEMFILEVDVDTKETIDRYLDDITNTLNVESINNSNLEEAFDKKEDTSYEYEEENRFLDDEEEITLYDDEEDTFL